jgi:peptidoglycan-associated lipoprotein
LQFKYRQHPGNLGFQFSFHFHISGRFTMRKLHTLTIAVSTAAFLAACSSTPPKQETATTPAKQDVVKTGVDNRKVEPVTAVSVDPLNDPKGVLAQRSVYFDFDSYAVKSDYNQLVTAHANYLESHKARKIVIQGNTDERGGAEYNLALGQKRAEAVRKSMSALGVSESQMEATSYGNQKPKAQGHDEAAWSQNRRADIVY